MKLENRTNCRACGAQALTPILKLEGDDGYVLCDPSKDINACGLVQRQHRSQAKAQAPAPTTQIEKHRQRSLVSEVMEMLSTRDGHALQIECGDGSLLSQFPRWIETHGTAEIPNASLNEEVMSGRFPSKNLVRRLKMKVGAGGFDVITCVDQFAKSDDARSWFEGVAFLLAHDGVFVLETPYLSLALMRNAIEQFHHQANAIYSLSVLERLANATGLKIVRGAMSETAGGSLRVFFCHQDYEGFDFVPWLDQLARLWDEEASLNLVSRQPYQAMIHRVNANRQQLESLIREMKNYGEHAHILGADERMQKLLSYYALDQEVVSAVVDNHRVGPIGDIEVICESESRAAIPDLYIAPSHARREILESWRDEIFAGARIVFLSPEFEVVTRENYATALGKCLAITDGPGSVETLRNVLMAVRRPQLVTVNETLMAESKN